MCDAGMYGYTRLMSEALSEMGDAHAGGWVVGWCVCAVTIWCRTTVAILRPVGFVMRLRRPRMWVIVVGLFAVAGRSCVGAPPGAPTAIAAAAFGTGARQLVCGGLGFLHGAKSAVRPAKKQRGTDNTDALSYLINVAGYLGWNAPALLAVCRAWTEAIRASGPMFSTAADLVVQISKMFGGRGLWVLSILHVSPLTLHISDNASDIAITIAKGMSAFVKHSVAPAYLGLVAKDMLQLLKDFQAEFDDEDRAGLGPSVRASGLLSSFYGLQAHIRNVEGIGLVRRAQRVARDGEATLFLAFVPWIFHVVGLCLGAMGKANTSRDAAQGLVHLIFVADQLGAIVEAHAGATGAAQWIKDLQSDLGRALSTRGRAQVLYDWYKQYTRERMSLDERLRLPLDLLSCYFGPCSCGAMPECGPGPGEG